MSREDLLKRDVELICGLWDDRDDKLVKEVQICEFSGTVLKALNAPDIKGDVGKTINLILSNCIEKIGDRPYSSGVTTNLLGADADLLLLEIRKLSKGDVVTGDFKCVNCGTPNNVQIDIGNTEIFYPETEKFNIQKWKWLFTVSNETKGVEVVYRLPRLKDRSVMTRAIKDNEPFIALLNLASSCVVEWNGKTGPFPNDFLLQKPPRLYEWALEEFMLHANTAGPNLDMIVSCFNCNHETALTMEASDFLYPKVQNLRRKSRNR